MSFKIKKPNWDLINGRMEDQPLMYHRLMLALDAWLECGREYGGQAIPESFAPNGEFYIVLQRHQNEIRRQHEVQRHSNLTSRLRK